MSFTAAEAHAIEHVVSLLKENPQLIHDASLEPLLKYIRSLGGNVAEKVSAPKPAPQPAAPASPPKEKKSDEKDPDIWEDDKDRMSDYVLPSGADAESEADQDRANTLKGEAAELMGTDLSAACAKITEALKLKPSSSMWWALRAQIYLKMKRPRCAISDATEALKINPDSAKALRTRGMGYRHLGDWVKAADDLNASNKCDFNEDVAAQLKIVQEKANQLKMQRRAKELREEEERAAERARRQEELRKQRQREQEEEEAEKKKSARQAPGAEEDEEGIPDMGGMGGIPGFGGMPPPGTTGGLPPQMAEVFNDPDVKKALQDPTVAAKLAQLMQNPALAPQMMMDPKVGPIMQKIIAKMGANAPGGIPHPVHRGQTQASQPPPPRAQPQSKPHSDDLD